MSIIAVVNTNEETIEMLRMALQMHGFESVAAHAEDIKRGRIDFLHFLEQHDPKALIYDVAPPYDHNWNFLKLLRSSESMRGRPVIVTTTHKPNLEKLVGRTDAIEIVGKPYDIEEVVRALQRALQ